MPTCPGCSTKIGRESLLGSLGTRKHYRCRWCGMMSSRASRSRWRKPKVAETPKAEEKPPAKNECRVYVPYVLSESEEGQGVKTKRFVMFARSKNATAFGHQGHLWVAKDGHVIQGHWSPYQNVGKSGPGVNTMADFPLTGSGRVAHGRHLGYEQVHDMPSAPKHLIDTVWRDAEHMQALAHLDKQRHVPYRPHGLGEACACGTEDKTGAPNLMQWTRRLRKVGEKGAVSVGREVSSAVDRIKAAVRGLRETTTQRYAAGFGSFKPSREHFGDRVVLGHHEDPKAAGRTFVGTGEYRPVKPGEFYVDTAGPLPRVRHSANGEALAGRHIARPVAKLPESSLMGSEKYKGWMSPSGVITPVTPGREHGDVKPIDYPGDIEDAGDRWDERLEHFQRKGYVRFGKHPSSTHGSHLFIHYDGQHPRGHKTAFRLLSKLRPEPHEPVAIHDSPGYTDTARFRLSNWSQTNTIAPAHEVRRMLIDKIAQQDAHDERNPYVAMKTRFAARSKYLRKNAPEGTDHAKRENEFIAADRAARRGSIRRFGVAFRKQHQDANASLFLQPYVQKKMKARERKAAKAASPAAKVVRRKKAMAESLARYVRQFRSYGKRASKMSSDYSTAAALRHANASHKFDTYLDYLRQAQHGRKALGAKIAYKRKASNARFAKRMSESSKKYFRKLHGINNRRRRLFFDALSADALGHANAGYKEKMLDRYVAKTEPRRQGMLALAQHKLTQARIKAQIHLRRLKGQDHA